MYNLVALSIFTMLCSCPHYFQNFEALYTHGTMITPRAPSFRPLVTTVALSVSMNWTAAGTHMSAVMQVLL